MRRPFNTPTWRRLATPIALALLSLLTATVLWVAVNDAENPSRTGVFSGAIEIQPVNVPDGFAVFRIEQPTVSVRVSADEETFRRLNISDFQAVVDLAGERRPASDKVVIANVTSRKDVQIIEVSPPVVNVTLEQATSKQVPVQVNRIGALPQGFSVGSQETNPATVRVSGAQSLISLVASADADVNMTGLRASVHQEYQLAPRDGRGADLRGVHVEPSTADVRVAVAQQEITLAIAVVPTWQGAVADGYNLISATPDPPVVQVSGPLEILQALQAQALTTEVIDISGLKADGTRNVKLRLPQGVQVPRDTVTVRLKVVAATGDITVTVAPQITGVAEGLKATLQTPNLNVKLRGDLPTLRTINANALRATVSASGLDEGVHVLSASVTAPDGVQVAGTDPSQVVLVLRR